MNAIANFQHEDIVCSFKGRITDLGFIILNFNVWESDQYTLFVISIMAISILRLKTVLEISIFQACAQTDKIP